jgi:hypothetical protein
MKLYPVPGPNGPIVPPSQRPSPPPTEKSGPIIIIINK